MFHLRRKPQSSSPVLVVPVPFSYRFPISSHYLVRACTLMTFRFGNGANGANNGMGSGYAFSRDGWKITSNPMQELPLPIG